MPVCPAVSSQRDTEQEASVGSDFAVRQAMLAVAAAVQQKARVHPNVHSRRLLVLYRRRPVDLVRSREVARSEEELEQHRHWYTTGRSLHPHEESPTEILQPGPAL